MRRELGYDGEHWCAYFWFAGWDCLSLGFHICLSKPNLEIHLPFGFVRIGRKRRNPKALGVREVYADGAMLIGPTEWREAP